jgi:iron complex outermembrane receptor protein
MVTICSSAQEKQFSGRVTSKEDNPVDGAYVHVLNTNTWSFTDAEGNFILNLSPGKYRIEITAVGFASVQQIIDASSTDKITIQLAEVATQLDDVVVSAEKVEGDVQSIPYSISAVTSRQVREFRLWNSKDITAIVPNLYSANSGDNRNVTSIRGITTTSYDPAVATYIDGVNQFGLDTYIAQLFDVERIEVLRGPQGTLYGRNAMGGVINIITKQPSNKTNGFVEASLGNFGQERYGFGLRTPLVSNKLFLGVAGLYDHNDGFYTNQFNNSDFDKKHSYTGNYYLSYLANPQWAFTVNLKHQSNRNNGTFPLAGSVESAFDEPFTVNQNAVAELKDNIFNGSLTASYAGPAFNFTSLTTYQSNYRIYKDPIDGDFSPIDGITIINDYGKDWNNVKVFTQEFKLSSPANTTSNVKWTGGVYLYRQNNPVKQATHFGEDAAFIDPNAFPFSYVLNTSTGKSTGVATFGQATISLLAGKLDLTIGARYDYEHKDQEILGEFYIDGIPEPAFETQPDTSSTKSFNAFSPKVGVSYHLNNITNIYGIYSRGFRAGGFTQLSPDPSQGALYAFKPEYSNNVEAGIKNVFFDKKLQINLAAFYVTVKDAQVPTLILPQAITVTKNAGELTSKGVELELIATPLKATQINYSLGYTHARYTSLDVPANEVIVDLEGNRQIFTPELTSMLAAQYAFELGTKYDLKILARGEWMYIGTTYFDLANNIKQSPYSLLNARAGLSGRGFEIMFWGRNLSDQKYIAYAYDFGATHLGNPKNWGVTVVKTF